MILALLAEENRVAAGDSKGDSQRETALYSKKRMGKGMKNMCEIECY